MPPKDVVVAMSGGVDSSVAALLLHKQGFNVIGVSMQVWDYRNNGGCNSKATCCAPDDFTDARKVAASIGVPYYVFDFEKTFRKEVIDNFIESYKRGITPNPCVDCNNKVKFRELRERATSLGYAKVATGHYARVEERAGQLQLLRGLDANKDQSYFLYGINKQELAETIFPVGEMCKDEVREIARKAGLSTASKPESQDICFVSGKVQDFLISIGGAKKESGAIVNTEGQKIAEHDGIHNFTVGQRKGLGISGSEAPLYVIEINKAENRVTVGDKKHLERESFNVNELSWLEDSVINGLQTSDNYTFDAIAQIRSRHKGVKVRVNIARDQPAKVSFIDEFATVSPGQAAVFYDLNNEQVLGGGRIQAF